MITMHPGEYITEMYLEPQRASSTELAKKLEVSLASVSRLLNGKADLSPEMAIRLSRVVGRSPKSWMSMQTDYALERAQQKLASETLP